MGFYKISYIRATLVGSLRLIVSKKDFKKLGIESLFYK